MGNQERDHCKTSRRWRNNIKMDLREIGWGDVVWIHVAEDRK
jgi:hypothetical protein